MKGSPGDFFEASKDDQRKYINQLLAFVRRYSERSESSDDERLRWSKARFAAAMVARATGHMDTETFNAEAGHNAAWLAWAIGGVLCPPESLLVSALGDKEPSPEKRDLKPSTETTLKRSPEQVRKAQEHARKRLLETSIGLSEPVGDPKQKLH
jgi:hypothetical protein